MRRSFPLASPAVFALVGVSVALVGCPNGEEPSPVVVEESATIEEGLPDAQDGAWPDATASDATDSDPVVDESPEEAGVVSSPPPGVTTQKPGDFLRPTLPDAALEEAAEEEEEVAPPPVEITDRSAEAEEPTVLSGDVPIDDLFEGLDATPKPER